MYAKSQPIRAAAILPGAAMGEEQNEKDCKRHRPSRLSQSLSEEEYARRLAKVELLLRFEGSRASAYSTMLEMFENWEWEDAYFEHLLCDEKQTKLDVFLKPAKKDVRKDEGHVGMPSEPCNDTAMTTSEGFTTATAEDAHKDEEHVRLPSEQSYTKSNVQLEAFVAAAAKGAHKDEGGVATSAASSSVGFQTDASSKLTEAQLRLIDFNKAAAMEKKRARLAAEQQAVYERVFLDFAYM
jgi:hypothetical protein